MFSNDIAANCYLFDFENAHAIYKEFELEDKSAESMPAYRALKNRNLGNSVDCVSIFCKYRYPPDMVRCNMLKNMNLKKIEFSKL